MFKLLVSIFLLIANLSTLRSQNMPYILDSVITQLCDVQWEETSYYLERKDVTDSSYENQPRERVDTMLMFVDTSRISDGLWHILAYPFYFTNKKKSTMTVPPNAPMRGNAVYHDGKIIIHYYEYEENSVIDEILFFDKNRLIIRHKNKERTECIEYKRYKRRQE